MKQASKLTWKGSLRISSSVLFWYLRISRRATVPGLYLQIHGRVHVRLSGFGGNKPQAQKESVGAVSKGRSYRLHSYRYAHRKEFFTSSLTLNQQCTQTSTNSRPRAYLWGFLTPPVAGADFLAALVASCLRGA